MATVAQEETVKITINDIELDVPKGELIVESVKRLGLEIPIFCYHPRMKPVGMCRMCLVEVGFKQQDGTVRMMPKPQAGCTLPAGDNMVVYTDTEQVHKDRKGVLEFLLINHPLDCPICDRGGECPLQNNTMAYGPSTSRFIEMKRHLPKAYPLSEYVTLDLERCIQCGRCVRFTEEISGDSQLAFRFRGASMQPSTFQLTDFESKFSGNVIEICPVGALTSSRYRFRARPWDLETKPGICTVTPCGTNVWFDHRAGKFIRINGRTNEAVNEEWTADRCKFGHDFYNHPERLTAPNLRTDDGYARVGWAGAYGEILEKFEGKGDEVGVLVSPRISNEGLYLAQKVARDVFGTSNIDHRSGLRLLSADERVETKFGLPPVQTTIAELEHLDSVLVFGTSLAAEQPMTFLRVRKGWFQRGLKVVVATSEPTEVHSFAHTVLTYQPGTEGALAAGLASLMGASGVSVDVDKVSAKTGVPAEKLREAAEVLKEGNRAFLTTHSLVDSETGLAAYELLAGAASATGAKFSFLGLEPNSQGAQELGVLPDVLPGGLKSDTAGKNTRQILEGAADGSIKALFLVGYDPLESYPDRELAERALENVDYLVYLNGVPGEAAAYASVVLPMAFPAEQDGSYTSCERRVQRMQQVLKVPGEAKSVWRVMSEIYVRSKPGTPAFHPEDTMNEIASSLSSFEGARYENLVGEGVVLGSKPPESVDLQALSQTVSGLDL